MARFSIMVINYNKWLVGKDGGYPDSVETITEASTEAEALNIVRTTYTAEDGYEVETHNISEIGEYANRRAKWDAEYEVMREAEDKKKNEAKARKVRREIEELKKELARKEAYLAKLEA